MERATDNYISDGEGGLCRADMCAFGTREALHSPPSPVASTKVA
jgi:hypothetical protein